MNIRNSHGALVDARQAASLMDADLREELHGVGFETEQAFFDAYCTAHLDRFGGEFDVNEWGV